MNHSGKQRPPARPRGITIIELAIAMLLVLVLAGLGISYVGSLFRAELRTDTDRLVASIGYLYNLAVINRRPYRLVIDMADKSFWGEELDVGEGPCEQFLIDTESEDEKRKASKRDRKTNRRTEEGEEGEEGAETAGTAAFAQIKGNILQKKRKLGARVDFQGFISESQRERTREGQVAIHFFPAGYVERAFVYLGDEEKIFTIETRPLQGTALVYKEELNEREFDQNDR